MSPLAVCPHYQNDSRKTRPPHAQYAPIAVETTPKTSAAPSAAIREAHSAFAELGLSDPDLRVGAELAGLVGEITADADMAIAAWIAHARRAGLDCTPAAASARFGNSAERLARQVAQLGD